MGQHSYNGNSDKEGVGSMENRRREYPRRNSGYGGRQRQRREQQEEPTIKDQLFMQTCVSIILVIIAAFFVFVHTDMTSSVRSSLKNALSQSITAESWSDIAEIGKTALEKAGEFLNKAGIVKREKEETQKQEKNIEEAQTVFEEETKEKTMEASEGQGKNQSPPEVILPES